MYRLKKATDAQFCIRRKPLYVVCFLSNKETADKCMFYLKL